jgi:hypothetical protein
MIGFDTNTGNIGDRISITGNNLINITRVLFSSTESNFESIDKNLIYATVPKGAAWGYSWVINDNVLTYESGNASGVSGSITTGISGQSSEKFAPAPVISFFYPVVGISGETVEITGDSLSGITGASINNISCGFAVSSNSGVSLTVPSGNTYGPITLSGQSGLSHSTVGYFSPEVKMTGFSLESGNTGDSLGIYGQYFFDELISGFHDTGNMYELYVADGDSSGAGDKYYIRQSGYLTGSGHLAPNITLYRNQDYYFGTLHPSNSGYSFSVSHFVDGIHQVPGFTSNYSGFSHYEGAIKLTLYNDAPDILYYYDSNYTGMGGSGYFRIMDPNGFSVFFNKNDKSEVYSQFLKTNNTTLSGSIPMGARTGPVYVEKHKGIGEGIFYSTGIFVVNQGLPEIYNRNTITGRPADAYYGGTRIAVSGRNISNSTGIRLIGSEVAIYPGTGQPNPYENEGTFLGGDSFGNDVISFDLPTADNFPHDSTPASPARLYGVQVETPIGNALWEDALFIMKDPINQGSGLGEIGFL